MEFEREAFEVVFGCDAVVAVAEVGRGVGEDAGYFVLVGLDYGEGHGAAGGEHAESDDLEGQRDDAEHGFRVGAAAGDGGAAVGDFGLDEGGCGGPVVGHAEV